MTSHTGVALRRIVLVLAVMAVAWLVAFASGVGLLRGRQEDTVIGAEGSRVTCRYLHATGRYVIADFTEKPDAVTCARFVSIRTPRVSGDHWAVALPSDKSVRIECRFFRHPADGDDGLGTRFTASSPLRLQANFIAHQFALIGDDDRGALGEPVLDKTISADNGANAWLVFSHGTTPILAGNPSGRLVLSIMTHDGSAALMLTSPARALLWSRDGGCRLGT